jgi:hypothetical protein
MCVSKNTYGQSKKAGKTQPAGNSQNAGFVGLSWDLRQKLAKPLPLKIVVGAAHPAQGAVVRPALGDGG